jgi:hypothetical protein
MMKTNITKLLFSALFVFAAAPAFSQFSAGLDLAVPNGNWSTDWGVGFGVSGRYEAPIQDKLNWTASAGFLSFSGKSFTTIVGFTGTGQPIYGSITAPSITIIPVTGGIKYYFQESNKGFYGAADIGFFIANQGVGTKFGFSPGVGYRLEKFDFAFRFNAVSDINYVGVRAAYIFPGK